MADMRVQVSAESLAEDAIEPDLIAGNVESDGADVDGDETYYWTSDAVALARHILSRLVDEAIDRL